MYHLQLLRGNNSKCTAYTGKIGELVYDTSNKILWIHDGNTKGGTRVANYTNIPTKLSQLTNDANYVTSSSTGGISFSSVVSAVTPSDTSDNSTNLATTAWVYNCSYVVRTFGNQTISGIKTFNNTLYAPTTMLQCKNDGDCFIKSYNGKSFLRLEGNSGSLGGSGFTLRAGGNSTYELRGFNYGLLWWGGYIQANYFQSLSDSRLKENKELCTYTVKNLSCYKYVLKTDGKQHVGLIAQDVEKVVPEAVMADDKGYKSLDYNAIVAVLVNEINNLRNEIDTLKCKINE